MVWMRLDIFLLNKIFILSSFDTFFSMTPLNSRFLGLKIYSNYFLIFKLRLILKEFFVQPIDDMHNANEL